MAEMGTALGLSELFMARSWWRMVNKWANEVVGYSVKWYEENMQGCEREKRLCLVREAGMS